MPYKDHQKRIEQRKRYRENNRVKLNEYKKLYFKKNPDKLKESYERRRKKREEASFGLKRIKVSPMKGKKHSEETKRKMSLVRKGKKYKMSERGKENMKQSYHKRYKVLGFPLPAKGKHWKVKNSRSVEYREKMSKSHSGENAWNWKGGNYEANRRARKRNAEGSFTNGEWELLKKQYGFTCPRCKKKEPQIKLTRDHIVPLLKGGSNFIENIQPLCKSCNSYKHIQIIKYEL